MKQSKQQEGENRAGILNWLFAAAITVVACGIGWIGWTMVDSLQKAPAQLQRYHAVEPKPKTEAKLFDSVFNEVKSSVGHGGPEMSLLDLADGASHEDTIATDAFFKATVFQEKNRFAEAVPQYTKALTAIESEAKTRSSWIVIGRKWDRATFQAHVYQCRAYAYLQLRKYKPALADLNLAIELSPDRSTNYQNRAKVYRLLGENSLAEADENTATEKSKRERAN
jgi:tetratricopeptide (TPR) repeat protein